MRLPILGGFVESVFMPLALDLFFSKPCITNHDVSPLRNQHAPDLIREQPQLAIAMLEQMRPQGKKPARSLAERALAARFFHSTRDECLPVWKTRPADKPLPARGTCA